MYSAILIFEIQTTQFKKACVQIDSQMTKPFAQRAQFDSQAFVKEDNLNKNKLQLIY